MDLRTYAKALAIAGGAEYDRADIYLRPPAPPAISIQAEELLFGECLTPDEIEINRCLDEGEGRMSSPVMREIAMELESRCRNLEFKDGVYVVDERPEDAARSGVRAVARMVALTRELDHFLGHTPVDNLTPGRLGALLAVFEGLTDIRRALNRFHTNVCHRLDDDG